MEDYTTSKYRIKFNKVNYDNNLEIKQFEKNAYVIKDIDYNNLSNRANFICKNCKLNFDWVPSGMEHY